MSFIFRKEKTPAELLLGNKRMFDRSIRDIERKKQGLQAEEEKLIAEMEKKVVAKEKRRGEVKQGGKIVSSCKSHDKTSYQNKHQITKFYALNHSSKVYLLEFSLLEHTTRIRLLAAFNEISVAEVMPKSLHMLT
ncbi:unnamed protein product [Musa acuminata subsp. malaccensis]|uniref:(wild Malaysian banana) hypothetical protein n=1 Tax=Musa acuminata subsp. malaccensis TaxID=214687 RepID=A0A804I419_MUSAM|nr:unnamed protein product [Musa acuminata subsp. malaccensis]